MSGNSTSVTLPLSGQFPCVDGTLCTMITESKEGIHGIGMHNPENLDQTRPCK
jgi:hypothetical protein